MSQRRVFRALLLVGVTAALWACASEEREVTTDSAEAYAHYEEGVANLGRFRLEKAYASFGAAIEADPEFAMAHLRLAATARELGHSEEFDEEIENAYTLREGVTEVERLWIERTYAAFQNDKDKANELYDQLVTSNPNHPWVLRLRAEYAKRDGNFEEALTMYDSILEQDPEAVDMHNLKGYLFLSMGRYEDAVQALQRYAFYAPEQANPHDSLGEAFLYTGRYEEAIQEFVKALEIDPTFVWSAMHLADVLGVTGQFQKARQVLAQVEPVIEERGWQHWWSMTSMRLDFRAEQWEDLLLAANANLEGIPDDERTGEFALWSQYTRTIAQLEMGNLEDALVSVEELETVAAKFAEERSEYAQTSDVMRLNKAYVVSRFERATGNPANGIEALWTAVRESELSPHELSMFRYELAEALLADSRPKEAVEVTDEMLDRIPNAPMMNLVAAKAHLLLGEREESLEHLQRYLEVMRLADQGNARVAEAQQLLQRLVPRS